MSDCSARSRAEVAAKVILFDAGVPRHPHHGDAMVFCQSVELGDPFASYRVRLALNRALEDEEGTRVDQETDCKELTVTSLQPK